MHDPDEKNEKESESLTPDLPEPPEWEYKRPKTAPNNTSPKKLDGQIYTGLGAGLSAAYAMVGSTLLGWFIGWLADRGEGYLWQAIGTMTGAIFGLVAAIIMIIRLQNRNQ